MTDIGDDASASLVGDEVCNGTREVEIKVQERAVSGGSTPTVSRPAMIATFRDRSNDRSTHRTDESLTLMLTDGVKTYRGRILSSDVKESGAPKKASAAGESGGQNIAMVRSFFLDSHPNINAAYMLIDVEDTAPRVKVMLRERLDSGIVKMIWSGYLTVMQPFGDLTAAAGLAFTNALPFASALGASLDSATKEIGDLRGELDKVRADLLGWKDTADKLDGRWQKEKDNLTDRFLALYNRVKADLRKVRGELSEEKKKKEVTIRPMVPNALAASERTREEPADNVDYVLWDPEEVDRLAAGPSITAKRKGNFGNSNTSSSAAQRPKGRVSTVEEATTTSKRRAAASSSANIHENNKAAQDSPRDDVGGSQSSIRANPLTGAVEMWGRPQAIFSESQEDFDANINNRNAKKQTSRAKRASSAEEDQSRQGQRPNTCSDDRDSSRKRSRHTTDNGSQQASKRSAAQEDVDLRTPARNGESTTGNGGLNGNESEATTDGEVSEPLL